jgi:excisionase family DNA binding protein
MRASARTQAIGCDDGKYLIARCPHDWDVSTPQSLWEESPYTADLTLLLKPTEVAAQLGVSRTWLYDAARTGRIPSIRIGGPDGPLRFIPEDLQRWIDDARAERPPLIFLDGTHAQARSRRCPAS